LRAFFYLAWGTLSRFFFPGTLRGLGVVVKARFAGLFHLPGTIVDAAACGDSGPFPGRIFSSLNVYPATVVAANYFRAVNGAKIRDTSVECAPDIRHRSTTMSKAFCVRVLSEIFGRNLDGPINKRAHGGFPKGQRREKQDTPVECVPDIRHRSTTVSKAFCVRVLSEIVSRDNDGRINMR